MSSERVDVLAELRTTYCSPESYAAVVEFVEAAVAVFDAPDVMWAIASEDERLAERLELAILRIRPDGQG